MFVEVITPAGCRLKTEASAVNAPGVEGRLTILRGHAPLVCGLQEGVLRITPVDGRQLSFNVSKGVMTVGSDKVCLLVAVAALVDEPQAAAVTP